MFEIKDGTRTLQFNGMLLAESSSWRRGSYRWIEFKLYKTDNGSYVLSRIGVSIVYHGATCPLVSRYALNEASRSELDSAAVLCGDQRESCPVACQPDESIDLVFPEKYRYCMFYSFFIFISQRRKAQSSSHIFCSLQCCCLKNMVL